MRKCKGGKFPYDLLGSYRNKLATCGREINWISNARHFLARREVVNCEIKYEEPNRATSKL